MTTCASCGQPGHRYGRNEGPKRYDPMACINTLRNEVERLYLALTEIADQDYRGNKSRESAIAERALRASASDESRSGS